MRKIIVVAGARPNFIKIAPLLREFKEYSNLKPILVHTGQHYDKGMSQSFFQDLKIPKPDYNLEVGSGSHGQQTGRIIMEFEKVCLKEKPNLVMVVGDVNSTLAGALVAAKLCIPLAHIEAGLRSYDRRMPEEINRLLTDQISDWLFVTEPSAIKNLTNEGIPRRKIFYVGNIMIDSLLKYKSQISNPKSQTNSKSKILNRLKLEKKNYAVLTLHRPENVDDKKTLQNLFETFKTISQKISIIFPAHPRTIKQIKKFGLGIRNCLPSVALAKEGKLKIVASLGYLNMLLLMVNSKLILTDSGGIQEEATALGIPCLTLRQNTERPITVSVGTNIIVGNNKKKTLKEIDKIMLGQGRKGKIPKYWDGHTAKRIVKILANK